VSSNSTAITARLGLDRAPFNQGLRQSAQDARRGGADIANNLRQGVAPISGAINNLVSGAGAGLVASLSVGTISEAVSWLVEYGGAIQDAADEVNMATDTHQQLVFAFAQSGAKAEQAQVGMLTLSKNVEAAAGGNEKLAASFARVGVTMDMLRHADLNEIIEQMADGFTGMPDGIQSTALAIELMGKNGAKMAVALRAGREELEATKKSAAILSKEDLKILAEAGDAWDALKDRSKVVIAQLAMGKAPDWLLKFTTMAGPAGLGLGMPTWLRKASEYYNPPPPTDPEAPTTIDRGAEAAAAKQRAIEEKAAKERADEARELKQLSDTLAEARENKAARERTSEQQLQTLLTRREELQDQITSTEEGSVDGLKARIEAEKLEVEIASQKAKVTTEREDAEKKANDRAMQAADKILKQMEKSIEAERESQQNRLTIAQAASEATQQSIQQDSSLRNQILSIDREILAVRQLLKGADEERTKELKKQVQELKNQRRELQIEEQLAGPNERRERRRAERRRGRAGRRVDRVNEAKGEREAQALEADAKKEQIFGHDAAAEALRTRAGKAREVGRPNGKDGGDQMLTVLNNIKTGIDTLKTSFDTMARTGVVNLP
jgi:hypothetical protein